ncbi:MAG: hypothetical protein HOE90_21565 [Bacteriovoracaceae bacterium]|jgi:hypothetical protein|nr:hypothetical protein [Bacteriovoracaceae bacterium]
MSSSAHCFSLFGLFDEPEKEVMKPCQNPGKFRSSFMGVDPKGNLRWNLGDVDELVKKKTIYHVVPETCRVIVAHMARKEMDDYYRDQQQKCESGSPRCAFLGPDDSRLKAVHDDAYKLLVDITKLSSRLKSKYVDEQGRGFRDRTSSNLSTKKYNGHSYYEYSPCDSGNQYCALGNNDRIIHGIFSKLMEEGERVYRNDATELLFPSTTTVSFDSDVEPPAVDPCVDPIVDLVEVDQLSTGIS